MKNYQQAVRTIEGAATCEKKRVVGLTADGRIAGEWHPGVKLSDHDIDLIRELHEPTLDTAGNVVKLGIGYRALARKFECAKSTIRDIVKCRRRFAIVTQVKAVRLREGRSRGGARHAG